MECMDSMMAGMNEKVKEEFGPWLLKQTKTVPTDHNGVGGELFCKYNNLYHFRICVC